MTQPPSDPFWLQVALGHPQTCDEGVTRGGEFQPCDKTAVALRLDPEEEDQPYPVCAYHSRANMVPLEEIVRFLLNRERAQQMVAEGLVRMAYAETVSS